VVNVVQKLLHATLFHGEKWTRIGPQLNLDPELTRRLYKAARDSMKNSAEPWSEEEDKVLLGVHAENMSLLGATSIDLYRRSNDDPENFSFFSIWRNMSHILGRTSMDCRLRARLLLENRSRSRDTDQEMTMTNESTYTSSEATATAMDTWMPWEVAQLVALIGPPGQVDVPFAQVGRHLGRSSRQCYLCYHSAQYSTITTNTNYMQTGQDANAIAQSILLPAISDKNMDYLSAPVSTSSGSSGNMRSWSSRRWTAEEDELLTRLVQESKSEHDIAADTAAVSWTLISSHPMMTARTPASCFARHQLLTLKAARSLAGEIADTRVIVRGSSSSINSNSDRNSSMATLWTDEKKMELAKLVTLYGGSWTRICHILGPGYSPYSARSVYMRMALSRPTEFLIPVKSRLGFGGSRQNVVPKGAVPDNAPLFRFLNASVVMENQNRVAAVQRSSQWVETEGLGRRWTRDDDRVLAQLARQSRHDRGEHWALAVAEQMNRSPEDVMMRFDFKLSAHRHGSWTRQEDARLIEFVEQHGDVASGWSKIGDEINRSAAQCALRWRVTLDPRLKWRPWSADEDERLCFLREERGYNWVMISASLNRASSSCRYRFVKLKTAGTNDDNNNSSQILT